MHRLNWIWTFLISTLSTIKIALSKLFGHLNNQHFHCVKFVRIRSFSGSYFPVFSPNAGNHERIQKQNYQPLTAKSRIKWFLAELDHVLIDVVWFWLKYFPSYYQNICQAHSLCCVANAFIAGKFVIMIFLCSYQCWTWNHWLRLFWFKFLTTEHDWSLYCVPLTIS